MAATTTIDRSVNLEAGFTLSHGRISFDNSYPTGGEALDPTGQSFFDTVFFETRAGYSFEWDKANQKVIVYYVDNNAAGDSAQIQVPDTTDLSALTDVGFLAVGA